MQCALQTCNPAPNIHSEAAPFKPPLRGGRGDSGGRTWTTGRDTPGAQRECRRGTLWWLVLWIRGKHTMLSKQANSLVRCLRPCWLRTLDSCIKHVHRHQPCSLCYNVVSSTTDKLLPLQRTRKRHESTRRTAAAGYWVLKQATVPCDPLLA